MNHPPARKFQRSLPRRQAGFGRYRSLRMAWRPVLFLILFLFCFLLPYLSISVSQYFGVSVFSHFGISVSRYIDISASLVSAQELNDNDSTGESEEFEEDLEEEYQEQLGDLEDKIKEYEDKIAKLQSEERTLQNEINYMNNQIYLTSLKINDTEAKIVAKEEELGGLRDDIGDLQERILTLGELLDSQRAIFATRARESYKSSRITSFEAFFGVSSLSRLVERVKYLRVLELNDQKLLGQMETTREGCTMQKELLEIKKVEVEEVKAEIEAHQASLVSQKASLASQKHAKTTFLAATQSDERKYQELLREARAQIAAIRSLVSARGGATLLSDQTECDDWGCYYNQRDKQWGTQSLGNSGSSVAEYGCLVSSVAMIATHYGYDLKPSDIASDSSAFFSDTAYLWKSIVVAGVSVDRISKSRGYLDSELDNGPVIAGIYSGPAHFIVIKEKTDDGDYRIHDPWYEGAHDALLSDYYNFGDITRVDRVRVY